MITPFQSWQRVRESNACTSLESAVAFPRVTFAVARLLTESAMASPRFCGRTGVADESRLGQRVAPDLINESCTLYECELAILPPFNGHFPLWSQK